MSVVSWAHSKSNTIYAANVSKTLSRHRPTTAPQERSRLLSKSSFFLFVSFQLCNEQLQKGIRTNFKQGQIKVHSSKLHSILSKGSVFHSHNSSFPIFLNISHMSLFFFSLSLPCSLSLSLFPSSFCASVICSKGLRVGYSVGCYGVWPQFSTQLLIYSHHALHWVSDCICVRLYASAFIILYDLPHLFAYRCSGTRRPQRWMWVSWISWVTPSLKSTIKRQRYMYCTVTSTQPCMRSYIKAKTNVCVFK